MDDYNYEYFYPGTNISIKQVQEIEYEILIEFDRICKECNIPYQLIAGTLLGAVRHQDFIPWDDDIDVCMRRSDFDTFLKECSGRLGNKYFLQTCQTDPKSVVQFAKIRKNGTVYENDTDNLKDTHTGIWIDIFPLDNTKAGTIYEKIQYFEVTVLYSIITSSVKNRVVACKCLWKRILRYLFYGLTKIIPKSVFERRLHSVMTRYDGADVGYISNYSNGTGWCYTGHVRKSEGFYDTILMKFHNDMFPVPHNYDEILRYAYGDYMKFPPIEKRTPLHGVTKVDIGVK